MRIVATGSAHSLLRLSEFVAQLSHQRRPGLRAGTHNHRRTSFVRWLPSCRIVRTRRMGPGSEAVATKFCWRNPEAQTAFMPIEAYTFAFFSVFAILARHSSPAAALNFSTTSGDNRRVTASFGLSTFGRPRDRLILACISGNTSLNGFARAKSSFVHSGLSETALMSALV